MARDEVRNWEPSPGHPDECRWPIDSRQPGVWIRAPVGVEVAQYGSPPGVWITGRWGRDPKPGSQV